MTLYENYQYERNEGRKEGREEAFATMVREGAISPTYAAEKLGISEAEFNKLLQEAEKE